MGLYPGGNPTPPYEIQVQVSLLMGLVGACGFSLLILLIGWGIKILLRMVLGEEKS